MLSKPLVSATVAGTVVFATNLLASAAAAAPELAAAGPDWSQLIEKSGTAAVLIWMVVWFQKRLEAKDAVVQALTVSFLETANKMADAQTALAKSNEAIATAINNLNKH